MDSEAQRRFLEEYRAYAEAVLEPTHLKTKQVLRGWKTPEYWAKYSKGERSPAPSPVQRVRMRIKRPESALDKIIRKPNLYLDAQARSSITQMSDALGARVIVYFISQLALLDKELRSSGAFEIASHSQPVAYLGRDLHEHLGLTHIHREDKESGYASIHYVVRLREPAVSASDNPWFELQLRTLCEDLWGEIEHVLGYKPEKRTSFAVRKQFRIISRTLEAIDDHFNFLYEELSRYQEERPIEDADTLNAENIATVLGEMSIGCAQGEIFGMLKILASRGIRTVGALRGLGTARRIQVIRNTYRLDEARDPYNFELVTNLANFQGVESEPEMIDRIRAQMEFLKTWTDFRRSKND
jgi:putative GTP pyrophosphokinase